MASVRSPSGSGGALVGTMLVRTITIASVAVACCTIALSYILAVSLKHVPAWLPMISDCAVKAPERFIFRYGMVVSATLVGANVLLVHAATKASYSLSKVTLVSGAVAAFSLGMLTVVNEDEDNSIHTAFAVVFFVGYEIYMIIISFNAQSDIRVTRVSLNVKRVCAVLSFISLVAFTLMSAHWSKYKIPIAVCEWSGVLLIQVFNFSFVSDIGRTRLEEVSAMEVASYRKVEQLDHQDSDLLLSKSAF